MASFVDKILHFIIGCYFSIFLTCSHSLLPWQLNQYKEIKHDKEFKITENYCGMVAFLQSNHLKVFITAIYCIHVK